VLAIILWFLNERSKRQTEEYKRKEESYKELLSTLRGFYVETKNTDLKTKFLDQINLCWLYTSDEVINKAYAFLDTVHTNAAVPYSDEIKEEAVGALIVAIRKDLLSRKIVKNTKLKAKDFRHLIAT